MSQEETYILCADCFSPARPGCEKFLATSLKEKIILLFLNHISGLGIYRTLGLGFIVSKGLGHTLKENIKDGKIKKKKIDGFTKDRLPNQTDTVP